MLVKIKPDQIVRGPDVQFTETPNVFEIPDKQAKALIDAGHGEAYTPGSAETTAKAAGGETAALVDKNGKKI